jgi:hypothetical protein
MPFLALFEQDLLQNFRGLTFWTRMGAANALPHS